jgi:hypothetical protein
MNFIKYIQPENASKLVEKLTTLIHKSSPFEPLV